MKGSIHTMVDENTGMMAEVLIVGNETLGNVKYRVVLKDLDSGETVQSFRDFNTEQGAINYANSLTGRQT